jgi:hypothetical protein
MDQRLEHQVYHPTPYNPKIKNDRNFTYVSPFTFTKLFLTHNEVFNFYDNKNSKRNNNFMTISKFLAL